MFYLFYLLFIAFQISEVNALDLTLQQAKILAIENNRDIKIESKNVEFSTGEVTKQKGAYDPVLNFFTSYSDFEIPTVSTFIDSGEINEKRFEVGGELGGSLPTGTFYSILDFRATRVETDSPVDSLTPFWETFLGFSVGQELLRGFGRDVNDSQIIVAKFNKDISVEQLRETISDILFEVERNYWISLATKKNLELERKGLELAQDLQKRNEIQFEVGVLPSVAVTQAESEVAAREVDVISAEDLLEQSEDSLKNLILLPLETEIDIVDSPQTEEVSLDEQKALEIALNKRTEILKAKDEIEKSKTLVNFYSNQRLPRLAVEASVNLQGLGGDPNPDRLTGGEPDPIPPQFNDPSDAFRQIVDADFPSWSILGIFSYPLNNRTATGEYIKAKADMDKKIIGLKKIQDDITLEVRDTIREIENSLRRIEAATKSVELAKEVAENEEEKLSVGLSTTRNVLEAQRDLIDARAKQIRAVADYNISLSRLERVKGTLLEINGIVIDEEEDLEISIIQ